jgi:hypothetical protein
VLPEFGAEPCLLEECVWVRRGIAHCSVRAVGLWW